MKRFANIIGALFCMALLLCGIIAAIEDSRYTAADYSFEPAVLSDATININTASYDDLITLDGIGDVYATKIIKFRSEIRPFETPEDLKLVSGIGSKRFASVRTHIKID